MTVLAVAGSGLQDREANGDVDTAMIISARHGLGMHGVK